MTKPSPELLDRVEEFYGTLMAWTHFTVAQFAEQIVRECAKSMCYHCEQGLSVSERNSVLTANGKPFWHSLEDGTFAWCGATELRVKFGLKE